MSGTSRDRLLIIVVVAALTCLPSAAQVTVATVPVANDPASAVVNPTTNQIFVGNVCGDDPTCGGNGSLTAINGATLATQTVTTDDYPYPIAINTSTNTVYAATCDNDPTCATGTVTVINGSTLATQSVRTGFYTDWVAVNSTTNKIYAVNECNDVNCTTLGTLTVIDGTTLTTQTVNVGAFAVSVAVNTQTNTIYVVNECGSDLSCSSPGSVSVIDGSTLSVQSVAVDYVPLFAAVDSVHNKIYVANNGGAGGTGNPGSLTVIDGATLATQSIAVGIFPAPVTVNPNTNLIYVGNRCGSDPNCYLPPSVSVIDGSTFSTQTTVSICTVGTYPSDLVGLNTTTNKIYFPCNGRTTQQYTTYGLSVNVLDGATNTVAPIAVGDYPGAAAVNSTTNQIYVPNEGDGTVSVIGGATKLQLFTVTPCRLIDTRQTGGPIQGGMSRNFVVPQLGGCNIPTSAAAYSLNVTVVPHESLNYLTIWPTPEIQPYVSTLNSYDGRIKANAAIVPAGVSGTVSVYVTNTTDVILDIDGYFAPAASGGAQFFSLTPCRVVDTRGANGNLGGPYLQPNQPRDFPILSSSCLQGVNQPLAYSFNVTVVPHPLGQPLNYLTVWPSNVQQPYVSTLNNPTATVVANAAIVPAAPDGDIDAFATNGTDLIIDINGYFAAPGSNGLSMYPLAPCRVLDTRTIGNGQPFSGTLSPPVNVVGSSCGPASNAGAYIFNATVVPTGSLNYLTLWPDGSPQPYVSTLNAVDGIPASDMAIVPTTNGSIDAYASGLTQLILDISGYFAP